MKEIILKPKQAFIATSGTFDALRHKKVPDPYTGRENTSWESAIEEVLRARGRQGGFLTFPDDGTRVTPRKAVLNPVEQDTRVMKFQEVEAALHTWENNHLTTKPYKVPEPFVVPQGPDEEPRRLERSQLVHIADNRLRWAAMAEAAGKPGHEGINSVPDATRQLAKAIARATKGTGDAIGEHVAFGIAKNYAQAVQEITAGVLGVDKVPAKPVTQIR